MDIRASLLVNILTVFRHKTLLIIKKIFRFLVSEVKRIRANNQNMNELRGLNSHELSDIGLSRIDLERTIQNPRDKDFTLRNRRNLYL
jgi:uncharacterized protein YjiS (DUF1127 family)